MIRGSLEENLRKRLFSSRKEKNSKFIRKQYQEARIAKKRANRERMADQVVLIDEEKEKRDFVKKFSANMVVETYEQVF